MWVPQPTEIPVPAETISVVDRRSRGWFWAENQVFDSTLSPSAKFVYLCLCRMASNTGRCYPSHAYIAERTGLSVSSVQRAMSELICDGRVERESGAEAGKPNVYRLVGWGSVTVTEGSVSVTEGGSVTGTDKGRPSLKDDLTRTKKVVIVSDDAFVASLKANPAYQGIDVDREIGKCQAWLMTPRGQGKHLTRQRLVNWLNKCDRPMAAATPAPKPTRPGMGDLTDLIDPVNERPDFAKRRVQS